MFNWIDRVYKNARKRVFKNLDTGEILNLELQDDPSNISKESPTPLTAHCLNMAQQELVEDMSKTYMGMNITAPTVAGLGRINKTYGKTTEQGAGTKSPDNPFILKCVGDMVDLFDESNYKYVANAMVNSAGLISAVAENYRIIYVEVKPNTEYVISFNVERSIVLTTTSVLPAVGVQGTPRQVATAKEYTITTDENAKYLCLRSDCRSSSSIQNYLGVSLKIQTKWKQGDKGTVETVSKNGSNTSSNIVYVDKPLCSVGNVRDEIDYNNKKIIRRLAYEVFDGSDDENWGQITVSNKLIYQRPATYASSNKSTANIVKAICSHFIVQKQDHTSNLNRFSITDKVMLFCTNGTTSLADFKAKLASNPITVIYELATPIIEDIECSNKITQYNGQTTVYNRDGAEIEVSLTNNKAIAEVNENIKQVEEKQRQEIIYDNASGGRDINIGNIFGLLMITTTAGSAFCIATDSTTKIENIANENTRLVLSVIVGENNKMVKATQLDSSGKLIAYPLITKILKI